MRKILLLVISFLVLSGSASTEKTGTVLSTVDAGGYTYAEIDVDGKPMWYAAPALKLKAGDQVVAPDGMPMNDFHSETLDRTFEVVYFVDSIPLAGTTENATALPAGHPPIQATACPAAPASVAFSDIEKPDGGLSVAEVYLESITLAGQPVMVRGKAVKVTNEIMGKNWIHLQDGTGQADSNDLTVTTTNVVSVGTISTARGILATDLDFGHGYTFSVLLQDATVEIE